MTSRPEDIDIQLACDGVCVLVGFLFFDMFGLFLIFCHAFMTLSRLSYFILEPYSRRRLLGVTDHVDQTVKHGERTEQHPALSNTERDLEEVTGPKRAKLHC